MIIVEKHPFIGRYVLRAQDGCRCCTDLIEEWHSLRLAALAWGVACSETVHRPTIPYRRPHARHQHLIVVLARFGENRTELADNRPKSDATTQRFYSRWVAVRRGAYLVSVMRTVRLLRDGGLPVVAYPLFVLRCPLQERACIVNFLPVLQLTVVAPCAFGHRAARGRVC